MAERARLEQIRGGRAVTEETDPEFWFHIQRAVLLALKDDGILSEAQLPYAEEMLRQRCRGGGAGGGHSVIKVASYCRVSTDKDDQANSFESQQRYFRAYIDRQPEWELYQIYADEGITGTSTKSGRRSTR